MREPLRRPGMRLLLALCTAFVFFSWAWSACSEASSSYGRYYRGRTLDLSVVTIERVTELRYSTMGQGQAARHYRLIPAEKNFEVVLVRLKVENHTATSAIVNVEGQTVELRDFFRGQFYPVNISLREQGGRVEEVKDPPGKTGWSVKVIQTMADGRTPPGQGFIHGAFELQKDMGVDGWMVFEAPKGTRFRELRWAAGDTVYVEF